MTIPSQEVPEGSEALKPFTKREREQLFVMTANGLQLSQAHRGWNDAAKLTMALRYEATIAELEKRSVSQPLPEAAPESNASGFVVINRPSYDELVTALADMVVKATDHGTQDGGFVATYLMPTGPMHRAIPLLDRLAIVVRPGFDGRTNHALPLEVMPSVSDDHTTGANPVAVSVTPPVEASASASAGETAASPEPKASPLCECGHAKHKGRCGVRVIDLGYDCLCVEYRPSVSGETAAPAPLACGHHDPASYFLGSKYANICGLPVGHDGRHACLDATWADGPSDYACSAINIQHEYIACELPNGHTGQHHHYGFRDWDASPTERRKAATITVAAAPATPTTAFIQTATLPTFSGVFRPKVSDPQSSSPSPSAEEDSELQESRRANRRAYQQMIDENIAWLEKMPRTLERDHVLAIMRKAVEYEYGPASSSRHPAGEGAPTDADELRCGWCGADMSDGRVIMREGDSIWKCIDVYGCRERLASSLRSARDDKKCGYCEASADFAAKHDGKHRERMSEVWKEIQSASADRGDGHALLGRVHVYAAAKNFENNARAFAERDAALSRVEELKRERADERKSLDTLSGLYYKLHDDFSALHDSKSHVEAERDELRGAFLKLREEVEALPRGDCSQCRECFMPYAVLSLLDLVRRSTPQEK